MPIDIGGYKYNSQMVDSQSYKVTPSSGLVVHLDAGKKESYPGSGTTWYDLTGNNNHGTLTNGPTFSNTNGGAITFDGVDDYIVVTNNSSLYMTSQISILVWFSVPQNNIPYRQTLVSKHYSEYEIDIYENGGFHSYTRNGTGGSFPSYNEGIFSYNAQSGWTANAMSGLVDFSRKFNFPMTDRYSHDLSWANPPRSRLILAVDGAGVSFPFVFSLKPRSAMMLSIK